MKVLIIGAGAVGGVLCKLLVKEKRVSQIFCCDIKKRTFNNKIIFKRLDISNKNKLLKFLKEIRPDVVINAVLPVLNTLILECCLKSKTNYLDMAAFWDINQKEKAISPYKFEQLDFHKKFKEKNIVGLIDAGVSPGITNLLAREASEQLDIVDHIKIRLIEDTRSNKLLFSWSKEWLLDEIEWKPLIYENKKFKQVNNFSGEEEFVFPHPFGKRKVFLLAQDEVGSIPLYINVKNVDLKAFDNQEDVAKFLFKMGLTSHKKIKIKGVEISPVEFLCKLLPGVPDNFKDKEFKNAQFVLVVEAIGKKKGKKRIIRYSAIFQEQREINKLKLNASFISYPTALSAKLFILSIPHIKNKGVFPPEALDKEVREEIIKELKKYCSFSFEIK